MSRQLSDLSGCIIWIIIIAVIIYLLIQDRESDRLKKNISDKETEIETLEEKILILEGDNEELKLRINVTKDEIEDGEFINDINDLEIKMQNKYDEGYDEGYNNGYNNGYNDGQYDCQRIE